MARWCRASSGGGRQLRNRALKLPIEHDAVGDDDRGIEDRLIGPIYGVPSGLIPSSSPRNTRPGSISPNSFPRPSGSTVRSLLLHVATSIWPVTAAVMSADYRRSRKSRHDAGDARPL